MHLGPRNAGLWIGAPSHDSDKTLRLHVQAVGGLWSV